ncbi:S24 family peptidase [Gordonia sp. UCD-TK1]|uniref:S24 family peptidase n=1 Tax=Gordonia sp. UCD-TK1 TaxID=1857893 RepID=UPI0020C79B31|nr:S24 family peptidase [Gordonia sp. UCD-TK1]
MSEHIGRLRRILPKKLGVKVIGHYADQARRALTEFFEAYSTSTVIYIELPDLPRGRALDSYFSLDSVEVREGTGIYADLGYTVYFTVNPTSVMLSDDLFALTIKGDDLEFGSSSMRRFYEQGNIRFFVIPDTSITKRARESGEVRLRSLLADLSL